MLRFGARLASKVVCTFSNEKCNDLRKNRMSRAMTSEALAALVVAVSLYSGDACAEKPIVSDTGYEIIYMIVTPSLHWVDNDRLLFAGMKAGHGPRPDRRKLYLWDDSTKSVKLYADAKGACVVDGVVRYIVRVDKEAGKAIVREGPIGSEREVEEVLPSKEKLSREPPVHSNFTCKSHLRSELVPPAPRFRHVVVLRKGDGYLDLQPGGGQNLLEELRAPKKNVVLYQASGKAIELPLTWDEDFSSSEFVYSAYRNAYILRPRAPRGSSIGISGSWPKGRPLVAYLLGVEGSVQTISIPYSITDYLGSPRPTVAGWIFGGGRTPSTAGLYVFDGKLTSKLDVGSVKEISVTSDGCKAAVAIQERPFESGSNPINIRIFDFCAGAR